MRRGKLSNQLVVGRWKLELCQLTASDPAHLLSQERCRIVEERAREEVQLNPPIGVVVGDAEDLGADRAARAEFLANLAPEAGFERLARLALAAGKLPRAREVRPLEPTGHEECAVALDDRSGHDDCVHDRATNGSATTVAVPAGR